MRYQPIYDIAELCARKNIRHAVLSPGSRCAPLTMAFARHPSIKTWTFSDERTAGFAALGMAQSSGLPVVLICTSGTAVYNLAPAVAEAFFAQVPLIVLSADRPAEWIGQLDGQTIFQHGIFGRHVKDFFLLPQDYEHPDSQWAINRMVNEAINLSLKLPPGPVHINAPFREPLYPNPGDADIAWSDKVRVIDASYAAAKLAGAASDNIRHQWPNFHNVLVVAGQQADNPLLRDALIRLQQKHKVPVVHDVIANFHEVPGTIRRADLFLGQASGRLKEMLRPDLLITFGQSIISKNLKMFLRKYPAKRHWHVQPAGTVADTYQSLTEIFHTTPAELFDIIIAVNAPGSFDLRKQENYLHLWEVEERRAGRVLDESLKSNALNELGLVREVMDNLPENAALHLANSMSVRYANIVGLSPSGKGIRVFSNRGTSGIDGATSTAVGHALTSENPNFLITGDLAFFYDRNAFWHNYPLHNLRVVLLNNHGGLIFDVLDGPSGTPEAREYFITRQPLNARKLCEEYGFDHLLVDHPRKLKNLLKDFLTFDGRTKILELEGDTTNNKSAFESLKTKMKESYES